MKSVDLIFLKGFLFFWREYLSKIGREKKKKKKTEEAATEFCNDAQERHIFDYPIM